MEELIDLLIRAIARWMMNAQKPQGARPAMLRQPTAAPKTVPAKTAVVRRKVLRRPAAATIAVAQPIITGRGVAGKNPAPIAPARPISVAAVASSHTGTAKSAAAIRKWLNPTTLKKEFILTEILRPPLSLRDEADSPHP